MKQLLFLLRTGLTVALLGTYQAAFAQLSLTTSQNNVTCNGGADGSATVIPLNGTGNYSYAWAPSGGNNATASGLSAGTYTVTVTDTVSSGFSEAILYSESFEGVHNWTLNVVSGVNGADPNFWTVSDAEGGVAPGGCGVGGNGNKTLHITSVFNPSGGASYDAGGLCGILFCPQTSMRAESPVFSTVGYTGITLEFDFISMGQGLIDNASWWYNTGSGWIMMESSIKSAVCGSGQGLWTDYTISMPAACDNNPNVQIAVNWVNNDDGVGTDPSVAINDVVVKGWMPGALQLDIQTATVTITEPAAIVTTLTESSCGSYMLNGQTYSSSGTYAQILQSAAGCDSTVMLNLTVNPVPSVSVTYVDFITLEATSASTDFQWIDCGTGMPVPGATSSTYTALVNGQYAVIVSNASMCSDTSDCFVLGETGLGEAAVSAFSVYPNPTSGTCTVVWDGVESMMIEVTDAYGRKIGAPGSIISGEKVQLGDAEGIYFIRLTNGVLDETMRIVRN